MFIGRKRIKAAAAVFCAVVIVGCGIGPQETKAYAASTSTPYNIDLGIGSSETEVRICWQSNSSAAGQLQIAKTSDMKSTDFPESSTKQAITEKVTATEGVLDNASNTDHGFIFRSLDNTFHYFAAAVLGHMQERIEC